MEGQWKAFKGPPQIPTLKRGKKLPIEEWNKKELGPNQRGPLIGRTNFGRKNGMNP